MARQRAVQAGQVRLAQPSQGSTESAQPSLKPRPAKTSPDSQLSRAQPRPVLSRQAQHSLDEPFPRLSIFPRLQWPSPIGSLARLLSSWVRSPFLPTGHDFPDCIFQSVARLARPVCCPIARISLGSLSRFCLSVCCPIAQISLLPDCALFPDSPIGSISPIGLRVLISNMIPSQELGRVSPIPRLLTSPRLPSLGASLKWGHFSRLL